ncbi:hypothetical protein BpHYR1_050007 [Brachionus plicatilis]|uniref:Uncharacterized protein n=1 Tax=Brachionus plicatilis TaxID=10195 RepID=A0A3M7REZ8_BRAPC|nr:hypothetical protein BpHYR1_050007 [Brachionus plicatilis]
MNTFLFCILLIRINPFLCFEKKKLQKKPNHNQLSLSTVLFKTNLHIPQLFLDITFPTGIRLYFIIWGVIACLPPSTWTSSPVMNEALSEAKKAMVLATSSPVPGRPRA